MIISIYAEKTFEKIQHPFMIKKKNSSERAYTSGIYLKITKATCSKPTANIILNSEKLKAFPLNQERDKDVRFQDRFGSASQGNQRIK